MILVDASLNCNLKCIYCYNREARRMSVPELMDMEKIKQTIKKLYDDNVSKYICLHGGEPMYWPRKVFNELLKFVFDLTGRTEIQTNATILDANLIKTLKDFKCIVGASIDGPWPLNRFRTDERMTQRVIDNIFWMRREGIPIGVIIVVSKANGLPTQRKIFKDFIIKLSDSAISGRMNPCWYPESFDIQLTWQEAKEFYLDMFDFCLEHGIRGWSPFVDLSKGIRGEERVCNFMGCDPFSTPAGVVVNSQGKITTCRTKHLFLENDLRKTNIRDVILSETDCAGCINFNACRGGCPSQSSDWRRKTYWCPVWASLFSRIRNIFESLSVPICPSTHSDSVYGDIPHGDLHGDHFDYG